ncbi:MAG: FAD-dependent oxidoreductase, partial [Spirochaetales bacterium]|nr:FAD-dependent oxidoreductase [Spirochaetales bacterium]
MQSITHTHYDLVVVGGGIAGSMAAVAAGREGLRVLLIEEEGYLGGSLTACGTGPMMTFHAGDKQVVRGLVDEMIQRLVQKGLSVGHIIDSTGYTYTVTPFDSEGMNRELE